MTFNASPDAAYGAAVAHARRIIHQAGAPDDVAQRVAQDVVNAMVRDGWKWVRREAAPALRSGARPGPPPDFVIQARRKLADQIAEDLARYEAREKQQRTTTTTTTTTEESP